MIRRGTSERLKCLDGGVIVIPLSRPNGAGMIEAHCENQLVVVFERDLDEASDQIEIEMVSAPPRA